VYDALNRPTSMTTPDQSEIKPTYNEASLLEKVEARIRGASTWTTFVDDIDYDAKRQREKIVYGNGVVTEYSYDPLTFRLKRLKTTRTSDNELLQDLRYTYDPVGNIVEISDLAQEELYHNSQLVEPVWKYEYDAIYRLIEATGREHSGQNSDIQQGVTGFPLLNAANPNDPQAMRNYAESFEYDAVDNIEKMIHTAQGSTGSWTRRYEIPMTSNRLLGTSLPGDDETEFSATYTYDEHGSMTSMPHLDGIAWDFKDQKREVDTGGGGTVYFTYDAGGQRVRKVWEHSGIVEERIYLGGFEVYRRHELGAVVLERETLHVMDDARRIAMLETKTVDTSDPNLVVTSRLRYQLGNHLGSAALELDDDGFVISYEEYHPYGTTAYHAVASGVEVSAKRYRYTGKERDEETGLNYHGARYYVPWLGRWTSADPAGLVDGANVYTYTRNNPSNHTDPSGRESLPSWFWGPVPDAANCGKRPAPGGGTPGVGVTFDLSSKAIEKSQARNKTTTPQSAPSPPPPLAPTNNAGGTPSADAVSPQKAPSNDADLEELAAAAREAEQEEQERTKQAAREGIGGFLWGMMEGITPFGSVPHDIGDATGTLPKGTRAERIGIGIGRLVGGAITTGIGLFGNALGAGATFTGIGALVGVPAIAVSTAIAAGGAVNMASGVKMLLSTGSGRSAPPRITPKWKARSPADPKCANGCENVARQIQKIIGGEIKRIKPTNPKEPLLGGFTQKFDSNGKPMGYHNTGWSHHEVVVKDGRVYDAFTGSEGLAIDDYKKLWEYAKDITFGF